QRAQQKVSGAASDIDPAILSRSPRLKAALFGARPNRRPSIEPPDAQAPRAMRASGEGKLPLPPPHRAANARRATRKQRKRSSGRRHPLPHGYEDTSAPPCMHAGRIRTIRAKEECVG